MPAQMQVSSKLASGDSDCDLYSTPCQYLVNNCDWIQTSKSRIYYRFLGFHLGTAWDRQKEAWFNILLITWLSAVQAGQHC